MRNIGIIPARMGSSRFPGKPMAKINGIPMIGHCYYRSKMSKSLDEVYVATCDREIYDYITSINGNVIMTKDTHERASDRAAEAMLKVEEMTGVRTDVLVMIQGDEPMIIPDMIDEAIEPLINDSNILVSNLMAHIKEEKDFEDPNEVKVVVDQNDYAIYFSREPIPSRKKGGENIPMLKQVCIIPFQRDYLIRFNELPQTPLEIIESVDMLRVIETGNKVKMIMTKYDTYSVDTLDDLKKVSNYMVDDDLVKKYE